MIDPNELKKWREIEDKATPGEWGGDQLFIYRLESCKNEPWWIIGDDAPASIDDAEFIAHARNTYRLLLDEVERLQAELKGNK